MVGEVLPRDRPDPHPGEVGYLEPFERESGRPAFGHDAVGGGRPRPLTEDLVGVFANAGCGSWRWQRLPIDLDEGAGSTCTIAVWQDDRLPVGTLLQLGKAEDVGRGVHRHDRAPCRKRVLEQLGAGSTGGDPLDRGHNLREVRIGHRPLTQALVPGRPVLVRHPAGKLDPSRRSPAGDGREEGTAECNQHLAIGGRIDQRHRHAATARGAALARQICALDGGRDRRVQRRPEGRGLGRDIDELAAARHEPPVMRNERADRPLHRRVVPDLRHGDAHGGPVGVAGDSDHPAHRGQREVAGGVACERSVLTEGGDRHVYETGIGLPETLPPQPPLPELARRRVLDEEVRARDQAQELIPPLALLEIQHHAAFPTIEGVEAQPLHAFRLALVAWRCEPRGGAARRLDFDRIGAEPREQVGRELRALIG